MTTLEHILASNGTEFAFITPSGTHVFDNGASVNDREYLNGEARRMAGKYRGFLNRIGMDFIQFAGPNSLRNTRLKFGKIDGKKHVIAYPSKSKAYHLLEQRLAGVGSVRFDPYVADPPHRNSIYFAHVRSPHHPNKSYIVSNGYGWGLSTSIDGMMADHKLTRSQAYEYANTEETSHALYRTHSESRTALTMYTWFMHCADNVKDPHNKARYNALAKVAMDRYNMHCKREGKKPQSLKAPKSDDHGHGGHGGGHDSHDSHDAHGDKHDHNGHGGHGGHESNGHDDDDHGHDAHAHGHGGHKRFDVNHMQRIRQSNGKPKYQSRQYQGKPQYSQRNYSNQSTQSKQYTGKSPVPQSQTTQQS